MSRSKNLARRPRTWPLWGSVSLIVLLSAVALALSYVALTGAGSGEHPGLPVNPGASASEEFDTSHSSLPTDAHSEPATDQADGSISQQRMLAMVGSTAMRATRGTCENPGSLEISLDGAQSWNVSDSLAVAGATQILRLLPTDVSLVEVVALDTNCEPQVYGSADLGSTWDGPFPVAGTWYFNPFNPAQVGAPNGPQPLPCKGAELAPAGDRAAVRCLDGSIVETVDLGITWSESPGVTDALAINYSPESFVLAQVGGQGCEGLRLMTLGGTFPLLDGCFETSLTANELKAADVAIAQSGSSTLLWVGDDLFNSFDGGETWL